MTPSALPSPKALVVLGVLGWVYWPTFVDLYDTWTTHPEYSHGLLVPLFIVPMVNAFTTIAGVSRNEIQGGKGIAFAVFNLGYCLFFFRMYPRVVAEAPGPKLPPDPQPPKPTT